MKNLKDARTDVGLTQKQLAQKIGISQQSYSDYENGRTFPDATTLIELANALNVSIDYLLGRTDDLGAVVISNHSVPHLTEDEAELLRLYGALPPKFKQSLLSSARLWAGVPDSSAKKKA